MCPACLRGISAAGLDGFRVPGPCQVCGRLRPGLSAGSPGIAAVGVSVISSVLLFYVPGLPHQAGRGDQASSLVRTAQMILAVLLAIAMVASRKGFLSSSCLSHGSPLSGRTYRPACREA